MVLGYRGCQAARWLAVIAVLTATNGCRWLPVQHVDPSVWPGRTDAESTEPDRPTSALPPLPLLSPVSDREALENAPTPMLDAAWDRLQALRRQTGAATQPGAPLELANVTVPNEHPTPDPAVDIRVDPNIVLAAATAEIPPRPWEDWKTGLDRLRAIAHERAAAETDATGTWNLRDRMLSWMAEASQDSQAELWQFVLSALASPTVAPTEPAPDSTQTDRDNPALTIAELQLCNRVEGFGSYDPRPVDAAIIPGDAALLYWEVSGPSYDGHAPILRSRLQTRLEILPAAGGEPLWRRDLGTIEDTCRRPRHDFYMNYRLILPSSVQPGTYRLRVTLRDEISGRQTESFLPLRVIAGP